VRVDQNAFEKQGGVIGWRAWQALGFDRRSLIADPRFLNPRRDDYRLRKSSAAFKLGFKPIPLDRIGLYASRERATWPVATAEPPVDTRITRRRVRLI